MKVNKSSIKESPTGLERHESEQIIVHIWVNSLGKISLTAEVEQNSTLLYFSVCALGICVSLFYVSDLCLTNKPALFFLSLTLT